ncbi:MAG: hypothetical protein ABI182_08890 [Candidatus Baltobacteraceae bacterium]
MAYLVPAIVVLLGVVYLKVAGARQNLFLLVGSLGMMVTGILLVFDRALKLNTLGMNVALILGLATIFVGAFGSIFGRRSSSKPQ